MTKPWLFRPLSRAVSRAYSTTVTSSTVSSDLAFPVKHVTRTNFEEALTELRRHVKAADFVAIDLEMTGVTSASWRESFEFDRFDIRYLKVKDSAEKFAVVQFGVCPFRWDPLRLSFVSHPHNFFVFPRQEVPGEGSVANEFLCQTTSIDFLAKYEFDFNACFREGVSYLSREQEEEALNCLKSRYNDELSDLFSGFKDGKDGCLSTFTDTLFCERMTRKLIEWRDGLIKGGDSDYQTEGFRNDSKHSFQTVFFKTRPAVRLSNFTPSQLKLISRVTKKHFRDLVYVRLKVQGSSEQLVVYIDSERDKELLLRELKDEYHREAEMKIEAATGFRHVIDLLSSEKKLIVGHNCFLDISHIYNKFIGRLSPSAEEFAASLNKYFPYIIDTKIILNSNFALQQRMKKSSTSLSSAFSLLCPHIALGAYRNSELTSHVKVEVQVDDIRSSVWNSGIKHEAGYDAFMTGCLFAQICTHLGIDFKVQPPAGELTHSEKLQNFINLLYLSWTNGDIINLSNGSRVADTLGSSSKKKPFRKIVFENIVLLWNFPSKLKASEIRQCISKVFGMTSVVSVYLVDETAMFVEFSKPNFVTDFLVLKEYLERSNDAISVLHPLSKLLEGGNTCAAGYETYKEVCSSPISKVLFADQVEATGIRWKTELVESELEGESNRNKKVFLENQSTEQSTCDDEVKQIRAIKL